MGNRNEISKPSNRKRSNPNDAEQKKTVTSLNKHSAMVFSVM